MNDGEKTGSSSWSGPARVLGIGLALAVAVVLFAVWWAARNPTVDEHVVECFAGRFVATCDLPGSDQSAGWRGGVRWFDGEGMAREGRPDCLPMERRSEQVRIGVVDVEHEDTGWNAVVWVDCRG